MELEYSNRAEADLEHAVDNYLLVSVKAAQRFAEEHDRCLADLAAFPYRGTLYPRGRRWLPIGRSGFRMVYQIREGRVEILRIVNMRREGR